MCSSLKWVTPLQCTGSDGEPVSEVHVHMFTNTWKIVTDKNLTGNPSFCWHIWRISRLETLPWPVENRVAWIRNQLSHRGRCCHFLCCSETAMCSMKWPGIKRLLFFYPWDDENLLHEVFTWKNDAIFIFHLSFVSPWSLWYSSQARHSGKGHKLTSFKMNKQLGL